MTYWLQSRIITCKKENFWHHFPKIRNYYTISIHRKMNKKQKSPTDFGWGFEIISRSRRWD